MEKAQTADKENLFAAINCCSPILSSGSERAGSLVYSPLSERNHACQGNSLCPPETYKPSKVGLLLSTPLQEPPDSIPDSWEDIRKLDEEELWIERTQVVTQEDHLLYCKIAKEVVNNIIDNLPILNMDENTPEFDDTVIAHDVKDDLVNGFRHESNPENTEPVYNGSLVDIVCEERKENIATDIKDVVQINDLLQLSDESAEKNGVPEDNDFIHSCSDLDTTVKELSTNDGESPETTLLDDKEDLDETVREISVNDQASSLNINSDNKDLFDPEPTDEISLNFDETSFKPAADFGLELDFLETCGNSSGADHVSDLARQSLYVKFDPLVEARKPDQANQDTGSFPNINPADLLFKGPIGSEVCEDLLVMDTPPEKPVVSRRALLAQAASAETGESTAPAAIAPVADLLELSPSQNITTSVKSEVEETLENGENVIVPEEEESVLVQPLQYSKKDLDNAVTTAVKGAEEKIMSQWNLQNSLHEAEMEKLLDERNKMIDENKVVKTLMMEYEQTMAQMIKDRENEQTQQEKSNSEILRERDQLQRDLNNTEKSFAHLHEKFGKLKTAVESYRKNEDLLKKVVKDLQEDVKNAEAKYQVLKTHAEQKLNEANVEINRVQTSYKTELAGLQAALKREKTKYSSVQQSLDQKINENKELTAICDELISKVGPIP